MTKTPKPVTFHYVGGVPLNVVLNSGRSIEVGPGDDVEVQTDEVEALEAHPHFVSDSGEADDPIVPVLPHTDPQEG